MRTLILLAMFAGQMLTGNYRRTPSILSAWPMNEGSGLTLHDVSGNSNTATISGAGAVTWTANAIKAGVTSPVWTGTGDAVASNAALTSFDGTQPFSVGFWVSMSDVASSHVFVSTMQSSGSFTGWEIATSPNRINVFLNNTISTNGIQVIGNTTILAINTLYYIVVTYDPTIAGPKKAADFKIYVSGVLQANQVFADTLTGSPASGLPVTFAARSGGTVNLAGPMGFVEIVPYLWTGPQVTTNFGKGPGIY